MDFGFQMQSHIKSAKFNQSNFANFGFAPISQFFIFFYFLLRHYM